MAILIPSAIIIFFVGLFGILFIPDEIKNKSLDFKKGTIKIDDSVITVEIAESDAERQRWLMFRSDEYDSKNGMILVYPELDLYALWLLNIQYNIDLIWFDERGNVVYTIENANPCKNPLNPQDCTFKTVKPAKYIVVSTSGFIQKNNITNISNMTIISI